MKIETLNLLREQSVTVDAPTVSVCCVTFNHANFIERALEAILSQRVNFLVEVLLHDDASTDGTRQIVERYAENFPKVIRAVLPDENQYSLGVNVLKSLRLSARGKYIAYCEGDDFWGDPDKLLTQVCFLEANAEFVMSGHESVRIDGEGNVLKQSRLGRLSNRNRDMSARQLKELAYIVPTATRLFRNLPIDAPPEADEVIAADAFLQSLLAAHGGYKFHKEIHPSYYTQHPAGLWTSMDAEMSEHQTQNLLFWLARYHSRIGNNSSAKAILRRQNWMMLRSIFRRMIATKPRFYSLVKKFVNR